MAALASYRIDELIDRLGRYATGLQVYDAGGPGECVVRTGQIVASNRLFSAVEERTRRYVVGVQHRDDLGLARFFLRPAERSHCVELADELAAALPDPVAERAGIPTGVSPNHVLFGCAAPPTGWVGAPIWLGTPVWLGTGAAAGESEPLPAPESDPDARPVAVAVLDTGLDPHPWFAQRGWFTAAPPEGESLDADHDAEQDRQAGHGTFISGVVLQHAASATVHSKAVLSSFGLTDDLTVAAGLRQVRREARDRGVHIELVNLSLGGYTATNRCSPTVLWELAAFRDCVVVAAAGNNGSDRPFWPAALPRVVAVGATGADGSPAEFSNHGNWVDTWAPGVDVGSSFVRLGETGGRDYGYAEWSGTSFAAPAVAGRIAAELAAEPGLRPRAAADRVLAGRAQPTSPAP